MRTAVLIILGLFLMHARAQLEAKVCATPLQSLMECNDKLEEFNKKYPEQADHWRCIESIDNLCGQNDKIFCSTEKFKICEMYFEKKVHDPDEYHPGPKSGRPAVHKYRPATAQ